MELKSKTERLSAPLEAWGEKSRMELKIKIFINETEHKQKNKVNKIKNWFLEYYNKIYKPLARLIRGKGIYKFQIGMREVISLQIP